MNAVSRGLSRAGKVLRALNWAGITRVVVPAGVAVGLVAFTTANPREFDLVQASGATESSVAGVSRATRVTQACPGPELSGIPGVPDATIPATVTAAAGPEELLPAPVTGEGRLVAASGGTEVLSLGTRPGVQSAPLGGAGAVVLTGEGPLAPAVAGTQEWRVERPELRGLVSVPCGPGAAEHWLLGGGEGPGRQERLVLSNPGANPVTADVTVHGAAGPLADPYVETVPPGGRVSLLLDAKAGEESLLAVHVRAAGGGVHATLTDTWIEGSRALGAETTSATAAPGEVQVVPGVAFGGGPTAVRVAVPGDQDAVVRVSVFGPEGLVPTTGESVLSVVAGGVGQLEVRGVPAGTYAVALRADVPVVASVLSRTVASSAASTQAEGTSGDQATPGDFAWATSVEGVASAVPDDQTAPVAAAAFDPTGEVDRTLHLISVGGNGTVEVLTVVDGTARSRRIDLLGDRLVMVDLSGASSVWVRPVTGSGLVHGSVLSGVGEGESRLISSMPLQASVVTSAVSRAFPLP